MKHGEEQKKANPTPDDINLLDPAVQACPYAAYSTLREQAPVRLAPETGMFVLTKYDDVKVAFQDHERFSKDTSGTFDPEVTPSGYGGWKNAEAVRKVFQEEGWEAWPQVNSLGSEPPIHAKFRKLIDPSFTAGRIKKMAPYIEKLIHELIDEFIDDGEVEFVGQFCVPLPMHVISDRLGLPKEDLPKLKAWSGDQITSISRLLSPDEEVDCARRLVAFQHYLVDQLEKKRKEPADDILSDLARVEIGGPSGVRLEDLISVIFSVHVGGNESTTNALSSGLLLLLKHPEVMKRIQDDRALIRNFIEEDLRLESPFQAFARLVRKDSELRGVALPKESLLDLRMGAANRDPDEFDRPDEINLQRKNPGRHLAFGVGHHYCVGAPLARLEMTLAFNILFDRLANIRLTPGKNKLDYVPHYLARGLKELHLTFDKVS